MVAQWSAHLPLMLEIWSLIPAHGMSEQAFLCVSCKDDNKSVHHRSDGDVNLRPPVHEN